MRVNVSYNKRSSLQTSTRANARNASADLTGWYSLPGFASRSASSNVINGRYLYTSPWLMLVHLHHDKRFHEGVEKGVLAEVEKGMGL